MKLIPCHQVLPKPVTKGSAPVARAVTAAELLLANDGGYLGLGWLVEEGRDVLPDCASTLHWQLKDGGSLAFEEVTFWTSLLNPTMLSKLPPSPPLLSSEGYPTPHALTLVASWPRTDPQGWFELVGQLWRTIGGAGFESPNDGQTSSLNLSTLGWSGNEALIRAMQDNGSLWNECWVASQRGGHHVFEIPDSLSAPLPHST